MPYDAESFKAGFAIGRLLWKPPIKRASGDTGLGWAANPAWLTYSAGIVATAPTGNRTPYTKPNDGWTVICTLYNGDDGQYGGDWCDVATISTIRDNVIVTVPDAYQSINSYTYLGLTWYAGISGQNSIWGGCTRLESSFPEIDMGGDQVVYNRGGDPTMIESVFLRIMQAAGVRRTS